MAADVSPGSRLLDSDAESEDPESPREQSIRRIFQVHPLG